MATTSNVADLAHVYPQPLVISPSSDHKSSIIFLHGRGDSGKNFAPFLLDITLVKEPSTVFQDVFPNTKFIFPSAPMRVSASIPQQRMFSWFNCHSLKNPSLRPEWQIEGLRETCTVVHRLVQAEVDAVGAENVVVGGLSQGCASALTVLLTWRGPQLGGAFGSSGWLPFKKFLLQKAKEHSTQSPDTAESDRKAKSSQVGAAEAPEQHSVHDAAHAILSLRQELGLAPPDETVSTALPATPILIGHGVQDDVVNVKLGEGAATCLKQLGLNVEWHAYDDLGHWFNPEMLIDFCIMLREKSGWPVSLNM